MKALVTGGAGYIGSHTCKALAEAGHEVLVYDNLCTGHRDFVRWGPFVEGDIRDTSKLRSAIQKFRPDAVIHFAALSLVGESIHNPGKFFRNNVEGTLSLLEAMRDENVDHIVVSGTCAVYGQPETVPIVETMPTNPINPYGASKLFMERMLGDFATAHGLGWMSLRYFNAAGCDPAGEVGELHTPETHLIPRVILTALGIGSELEIFGEDYPTPDGTCIRDYIHVDDLARAHIMAAEHLLKNGQSGVLNLGTGNGASIKEIVGKLEELVGRKIPHVFRGRRSGDAACLVADATAARELLGWKAEKSLEEMLGHSLAFMRKNRDRLIAR